MKKILLTRTDRIGDVVLSVPAIEHVKKIYPDCFLALLVRPQAAEVVKHNPYIDKVILYEKSGKHKSFLSTVFFARSLRKEHFDMSIALHPTNRVHIITFLAGIPERVGYDRDFSRLLSVKILHTKQEGIRHEVDYNFDLLKSAGIDVSEYSRMPRVYVGSREKERIDELIKDRGIGKGFFVFHPDASCPSKRWPIKNFVILARLLEEHYGRKIVVVGKGDFSGSLAKEMCSCLDSGLIDLTNILGLGELTELLRRSSMLISNDSGPVHLASSVMTPVLSIFGRNDPGLSPSRWHPLGEKAQYIHNDPGCIKCKAHNCEKGFLCLENIKPVDVADIVKEMIK